MELEGLLMVLVVVVAHGVLNEGPADLKCYKNTTKPDTDFKCSWLPGASGENTTYTLHYCVTNGTFCGNFDVEERHSLVLFRESVIASREIDMWVEGHLGNRTHKSPVFSVILNEQVQYDAPFIEKISRSSGNLALYWKGLPKEKQPVINEIQFRRLKDQMWTNKTLESTGAELEKLTLKVQSDTVYEVRVRRRAKQLRTHIWSAWSQIKTVPNEIDKQLEVRWEIGELNMGVRLLKLSWDAPHWSESAGGVQYVLTLNITRCQHKPVKISTNTTSYNTNVTASVVNISIIAINNVGTSPKKTITIPAQFLANCPKGKPFKPLRAKKCVEWYELSDFAGAVSVNHCKTKNVKQMIHQITQGMKDFVRYHYFVHIGQKNRARTIALCPIYKLEGVPKQGPSNVTIVDVTHNSVLVSWEPIPRSHLQGFLKHYVIYITGQNYSKVDRVPESQTNYAIENVTPGSLYIVNVAGETVKGVGANTTGQILLNPKPSRPAVPEWIIIVSIIVILALTIFCSFIIQRLKTELLPEIPKPVITETPVNHSQNKEELYPIGEEVHSVILIHDQQDTSSKSQMPLEESSLLEVCNASFCEDEDDESQTSSVPLNPDYNRLPPPLELAECSHEQSGCDVTTPVYRNGLVFELKGENTDIRTQL
ncbi:hypothetical protein AGOR_G00147930 [Albula goreensis]|uniref:Fibronectin type-III domain-containing protein n=1 Tax=Albula goreensis TaxID=1534307 RepID=A0A8T3DB72_9TELE|nr:hypothetical protein AGOR_G00147930 [Albula goreensis]